MNTQTVKKAGYEENLRLLEAYREGDREAGERIVELNRPLVYRLAGRFSGRGVDMSELVEVGTIGLVKAMNTFDFDRGCVFSTYAVPLIFGEIRRFLRDDGMIKVSREEKRLCAQLSAERERRMREGLDSSIGAVARAVGVDVSDAARALFSMTPVHSLDEAAYDESDLTIGGTVYDEEEGERTFDKLALQMAIEKLPDRQKKIIVLRYYRDFSQAKTAEILGLTQVKVSREEKKILATLRADLV